MIPVHLCGQSCDMQAIHALSQEYGFKVIEDASHAIGGRYRGEPIGTCRYSDVTVFSFHPVKIITAGEGGMALTQDSELAARMRRLRTHGITRDPGEMMHAPEGPWYYEQLDLGFNYRMTDIHAALGRSQLTRLTAYLIRRHAIADRYERLLVGSARLPAVAASRFLFRSASVRDQIASGGDRPHASAGIRAAARGGNRRQPALYSCLPASLLRRARLRARILSAGRAVLSRGDQSADVSDLGRTRPGLRGRIAAICAHLTGIAIIRGRREASFMPNAYQSPIPMIVRGLAAARTVARGFKVHIYLAESAVPAVTFADSSPRVENKNPMILGEDGRLPADIWAASGTVLKAVITDREDHPVSGGTIDRLPLIDDAYCALYPRTDQETKAGVAPSNYRFPPGNVLRYGADPAGNASSYRAVRDCLKAAVTGRNEAGMGDHGRVYFPRGTYLIDDDAVFNNAADFQEASSSKATDWPRAC